LKIENGKLKISVGGVPPQSIREDSLYNRKLKMPERSILIVCTNQTVGAFIGRPQVTAEFS